MDPEIMRGLLEAGVKTTLTSCFEEDAVILVDDAALRGSEDSFDPESTVIVLDVVISTGMEVEKTNEAEESDNILAGCCKGLLNVNEAGMDEDKFTVDC